MSNYTFESKLEPNQFMLSLKAEILSRKNPLQEVSFDIKTKNNGICFYTCTIYSGRSNIAPIHYLDEYYTAYAAGRITIKEAADRILSLSGKQENIPDIPMKYFKDYGLIRQRIVMRFVNYEQNKERLEDAPYVRREDLAVVFYYAFPEEVIENGYFMIRNDSLRTWEISAEQLYMDALFSCPKLFPAKFTGFNELFGISDPEQETLYLLTNDAGDHGASVILYPGIIKMIEKSIPGDFYIIPSSIHELILLPAVLSQDPGALTEMVREVNRTQVMPEDILSDHVYYYSVREQDFRLV